MNKSVTAILDVILTILMALLLVRIDHNVSRQERVIETEIFVPVDTLSDWQILEMAIALTESHFKTDAMGTSNDTGILQIRPIYVDEVNRLSGRDYTIEDAFNADMSLEMFNIVQGAWNPGRDIEEAIRLHNKSPYYKKKVLENMELIRRAEEMRRKIINFGDYETGE